MADRVTAEYTFNDMSNKKSTKNLPYLSTSATDNQIKALVEGLNGLTTNTLTEINRVETTDITNGGLEEAGYTFWTNDSDTMPAGYVPLDRYSGEELTYELQIVSKYGRGTDSGVQELTFSGKKPKGTELRLWNGKFMCEFTGTTYASGSESTLQQLQIHIAPTATAKGATLYLYFDSPDENMEAI